MQRKNTTKPAKRSKQSDSLAPFQKEAATLINILFDDDHGLPDFVVDEITELLTELEGETQTMWNNRAIMQEALPRMLKDAAEKGIDWRTRNSSFVNLHLGSLYATRRETAFEDRVEEETETARAAKHEAREAQLDGEAIARLISSPRVPDSIKEKLVDRFLEFTDDHSLAPEVIKAKYLLAIASHAEGSDE
jgi:hypothetical protein